MHRPQRPVRTTLASTDAELASGDRLCRGFMGRVTGLSDGARSGLTGRITGQNLLPGDGGLFPGNH